MKTSLIIPAGGVGSRYGADMPKQFTNIAEMPIIIRTLRSFSTIDDIVISIHSDWKNHLLQLIDTYRISNVSHICSGGSTRQLSVWNAINTDVIKQSDIVLVHDAVRPFASTTLIGNIIREAHACGAVIPAVKPKDTIKKITANAYVDKTIDRDTLRYVQTPQGFKRDILVDIYDKAIQANFEGTDSASLAEFSSYPVKMIDGEDNNIKITSPIDKIYAETIARSEL